MNNHDEIKDLNGTVKLKELYQLPKYIPPFEKLGQKSDSSVWWTKSLASYKTCDHDKEWVYMYAKTNLPNNFIKNSKDKSNEILNRPRDANSFESHTSELSEFSNSSLETTENDDSGPIIDIAVVIYDRYPKSKYHLLVLPLLIGANNPDEFKKCHLNMLKGVHNLAKMIAKHLEIEYGAGPFLIGYHAKPSMDDLHVHIISQDFDSEFIKHKQHYNSFVNPNFFLTIDKVEKDLKSYGHVVIKDNVKDFLKKDLRCHICNQKIVGKLGKGGISEMNVLQNHIKEHLDN